MVRIETDIIIANVYTGHTCIVEVKKGHEKYFVGFLIDEVDNYIPKLPKRKGVYKCKVSIKPSKEFLENHKFPAVKEVKFKVLNCERLDLL